MSDEPTAGDRPVPQLDFDIVSALIPIMNEHGRQETAEAMLRWATAFLRVEAGEHETAERLSALLDQCRRQHRANGRAEEARRRRGEHG